MLLPNAVSEPPEMTALTECAYYHESVLLWMEQNQIESATTSPLEPPLDGWSETNPGSR